MVDLKPCPFCGCAPVVDGDKIVCPERHCWGPIVEHYDSIDDAAEAWNRRALSPAASEMEPVAFQDRVAAAHEALFHDDPTDLPERAARFFEEAVETVQALGMSEDDANRLVAYTFSRPPGDVRKEIGAAALTLASLCVVGGWDMMECAEADLEKLRRPETIARIRAKRATRHGRGPLPGFDPPKAGD